jgi:hypothetical protein
LTGVDEIVLSLYAKGLTTGEISAHFAEIYGASVSRETVSRITDKVVEVRLRTGRSTPRSASPSTARKTSSGCGPAPAVRRQVLDERADRPA